MRALCLLATGQALQEVDRPVPVPGADQILIRVLACGVCRTDLHLIDGELPNPSPGIIPGHEVIGSVERLGSAVAGFAIGQRVGVPWLGWTCGECNYCRTGRENLCDQPRFTGYTQDGGYAEYLVADYRYCLPVPAAYSDAEAAPLLCAGLIGYRCLRSAGDGHRLGIYGFGAAAHIIAQVARYQGRQVYAFTRPGDYQAQQFARDMGVIWAGDSSESPPEPLDAAIIFAPAGPLVPVALRQIVKGGTVVCGGIHMTDIPSFPYELLWGERTVRSVANLTRKDGQDFMALASSIPIRTEVKPFPLAAANLALDQLREGSLRGAAVLIPESRRAP